MKDRRKNTRLAIHFPAQVRFSDGRVCAGRTKNISFGGALLEIEGPSPDLVGQEGVLSLSLGDPPEVTTIQFRSRVAHVSSSGLGVKFLAIFGESYPHFRNLMVLNSEDPSALDEELIHHPGILRDDSCDD